MLQLSTVLMRLFDYLYNNDLVICKDSPDYRINPCSAAPGCTRIAETHPTAAPGYTRETKFNGTDGTKCLMERILICL